MTRLPGLAVAAVVGCTASADPAPKQRKLDDFVGHVADLRQRLARQKLGHLELVIEEPFVVVGEGTVETVERDAETVRWAADILERDFFATRPSTILDIYLFRGADSYERGVRVLTGKPPGTPYGFYSRVHGGLFMNIATGGGTLVHEIVHPYVEADFPNAPPWLNEGLGSLFEQCAERDGHIVGLTNWRLDGLQRAIRRGGLRPFRALTALDHDGFYNDDSGTNYAQSRYLLYYLQQQGKLRAFYAAFRAARANDPTGYATLVKTLGDPDMTEFQARWERYVAKLRFP